jgi:hypothetical protein
VVTADSYADDLASEMLREAGVVVEQLPDLVSCAGEPDPGRAADSGTDSTADVAAPVTAAAESDPETPGG